MSLLVAHRLHLPADLRLDQVKALVRDLASIAGPRPGAWGSRPWVGIEMDVRPTDAPVHRLIVSSDRNAVVQSILASALPSVVAVSTKLPEVPVVDAVELRLTRNDRPVRVDDAARLISGVLAGFVPSVGILTYQLVLSPLPYRDRLRQVDQPDASGGLDLLLGPKALIAWSDLRRKQSEPPFSVAIRLAAAGMERNEARHAIGRAIASLRVVAAPDVAIVPRMTIGVARRFTARAPVIWSWPAVLNAEELAVLLAWPLEGVVTPWPMGPSRRLLPVPAHVPSRGRLLGRSAVPGRVRQVAMDDDAIVRHAAITGPTGTGKTTLLARIALADIAAGRSTIVIDPKGDLTNHILDRIPHDHDRDVIVFDPTDTARPLGLNLLETGAGQSAEMTAEFVISLLHKLYAQSWGPRTRDILHASLLTIAGQPGATLVDLPLLLTRPDLRRRMVGQIDDPLGVGMFWQWYEALSAAEQAQVLGPVMNKLRQLLMRRSLRNIIGQPTSSIELSDALDDGRTVLVNLATAEVGADASHLLGALFLGRLWQAIRVRRRRDIASVIIDEFQDVLHLPTSLSDVLAQSRSYGVGMTLAHQHLAQLGSDIRAAVMANARSRIAFQSGSDDARALAASLGGGLSASDLLGLPVFEAYAAVVADNATSAPFSLATLALPPVVGRGHELRRRSRHQYGRSRADVEQALRERISPDVDMDAPVGRRPRGGAR